MSSRSVTSGRSPVYTAFGAYDAVYIYADAVKRAGSTDADAVIKELEKTSYIGIAGRIEFDDTHDVKPGPATFKGPSLLLAQWRDGCKREVVWPKELAHRRLRLPRLGQEVVSPGPVCAHP